jgi:hypothetical protein
VLAVFLQNTGFIHPPTVVGRSQAAVPIGAEFPGRDVGPGREAPGQQLVDVTGRWLFEERHLALLYKFSRRAASSRRPNRSVYAEFVGDLARVLRGRAAEALEREIGCVVPLFN